MAKSTKSTITAMIEFLNRWLGFLSEVCLALASDVFELATCAAAVFFSGVSVGLISGLTGALSALASSPTELGDSFSTRVICGSASDCGADSLGLDSAGSSGSNGFLGMIFSFNYISMCKLGMSIDMSGIMVGISGISLALAGAVMVMSPYSYSKLIAPSSGELTCTLRKR